MNDGLIRGWRDRAARAASWEPGRDPEPVLEALALTLALELTGDLTHVPGAERDRLRRLGQRALLHVGGPDLDEDDLEALRLCAAIARDGLRALSGRPVEPSPEADTRALIVPSDVRRMLEGELDGFAAGSLARTIRRSSAARSELETLLAVAAPEPGRILTLAAADAATVLDPSGGRVVGALSYGQASHGQGAAGTGSGDAPGAEAVLFDGDVRRPAVYAEDAAPLRLVAEALVTDGVREGYWIGRVDAGVRRLEATLHVGDAQYPWTIELPE